MCQMSLFFLVASTIEKVLLWRKPKCVIDNNNIHINDNNNNSPKRGSLGAPLIHSPSSADSRLVRSDSYPTKPTIATPVNLPVNSLQTSPSAPIQRLAFRTPDMQPKILHDENAKGALSTTTSSDYCCHLLKVLITFTHTHHTQTLSPTHSPHTNRIGKLVGSKRF